MKILVLYFSLSIFSINGVHNYEIYGKWKLEKIKINDAQLTPNETQYFLTITKELITYNLEVNSCQTREFKITDNLIIWSAGGCTRVCCDGRNDDISNYIDYNGSYQIIDNMLIITTDKSILYLKRLKSQ